MTTPGRQHATWLSLALLLFCCGCASRGIQPRKAGDWMIRLVEVQVGAADFNHGVLDDPLDFDVSLLQDGKPVKASTGTRLSGRRGQRLLDKPLTWLLHFDPRHSYQVVVEEQAIIAHANRWELPPTPRLKEWPFSAKDGMLRFGKESYLRFELRKVEE